MNDGFMYGHEPITLERDVDAVLIPMGERILLRAGTVVFVTQALGGSYTININGNLARIDGRDADALGLEQEPEATGDGPQKTPAEATGPVEEALVWEQLSTCYDPEIPINIVDLGLIYECKITPMEGGGNRIDVTMTLTAPGCGMGQILVEDVRGKLEHVPNVTEVNVDLTFDPPWDYSMMSEAARLQTGMF